MGGRVQRSWHQSHENQEQSAGIILLFTLPCIPCQGGGLSSFISGKSHFAIFCRVRFCSLAKMIPWSANPEHLPLTPHIYFQDRATFQFYRSLALVTGALGPEIQCGHGAHQHGAAGAEEAMIQLSHLWPPVSDFAGDLAVLFVTLRLSLSVPFYLTWRPYFLPLRVPMKSRQHFHLIFQHFVIPLSLHLRTTFLSCSWGAGGTKMLYWYQAGALSTLLVLYPKVWWIFSPCPQHYTRSP